MKVKVRQRKGLPLVLGREPREAIWARGQFWVRMPQMDEKCEGPVWFNYFPDEVEVVEPACLPEEPVVPPPDEGGTVEVEGMVLRRVAPGLYVEEEK